MLSSLHDLIHFVNVAITAGVGFTVTVVVITLAVSVTVLFVNAIYVCVHHYATIMLQPTTKYHSNTY